MALSDYRGVGADGAYPGWLRDLRGKSGVYVIRENGFFSSPIAYVGESHTAKLYETLVRHFSRWKRRKTWWSGQRGNTANDPGVTYERGRVTVAVEVTAANRAINRQDRLIRTLRPRDNVVGKLEDAPF